MSVVTTLRTPPEVATVLGPRCMVRVSGLPFDAVAGLRQPRSLAWAEQVVAARGALHVEAARISDELYERVSGIEDDAMRRKVVNTRRQIFNGNRPKDADAVAGLIGGDLGDALRAWVERFDHLAALQSAPVVEEELAAARRHLRELAVAPRLRQGLLLASAALDEYMDNYVKAGVSLNKRQRRIERSLIEYVYRSACKTSPFSTFTGVALGEFTPSGSAPSEAPFAMTVDEVWTDQTQLNIAVLGRLGDLIRTSESLRADLPVTLVSGWTSEADRVRYVRRTVTAGDDSGAASFDQVSETMFFLHQGGGIDVLIGLCGDGELVRYDELIYRFANRTEAPRAQCDKFLGILLRLGLLAVPALQVDLHAGDPVTTFSAAVERIGSPWAVRLGDDLRAVGQLVIEYRHAPLDRRRSILKQLREALTAIQVSLGDPEPTLPQTLLFEDTRATVAPLNFNEPAFRAEVAGALASVIRIMPAFDMALPHRLTLRGFFLARYGEGGQCDDLLDFVTAFQEDIYEHYVRVAAARGPFAEDGSYVPADNWLDQPEIVAVDDARRGFAERLKEIWAVHDSGDIVLDDRFVSGVAQPLRLLADGFRPESHFLQLSTAEDEPAAVLNRSWGGIAFPFSRFTPSFEDLSLAAQLRAWHRSLCPGDAVFAEVTGGAARTNLNLHGRMTDFELVCPGETSTAEPEAQIPLDDLVLRHDIRSGRLRLLSKRLDREVIPVYFGYLVPIALPEISRTLLLLAPSAMVSIDPWGGIPDGPEVDGVRFRPRVRHGNLVLSRRTWIAAVASVPISAATTTPGETFVAWHEWRTRHGIPAQIFVTLEMRASGDDRSRGMRRQKPHYLDFDSLLSIELFEHMITNEVSAVILREMLPTADGLHTASSAGKHITEVVVETITRPIPQGGGNA